MAQTQGSPEAGLDQMPYARHILERQPKQVRTSYGTRFRSYTSARNGASNMSASAPQLTQLTIREVFKLKPVRRLWAAQVVSVFGDFLAIFAVISYVSFNLHASAGQVTLITVSFMIPFAIVGPVAGVFVDRWNVKRTMIASDLIRGVLCLALVFAGNVW